MPVETLESPAPAATTPETPRRSADTLTVEYVVAGREPAAGRRQSSVLSWIACAAAGLIAVGLLIGAFAIADTSCPSGSFDPLGCQTAPPSSQPAPSVPASDSPTSVAGVVVTSEIAPPPLSVSGAAQ